MTNPWMKKNPYLSLWLSMANTLGAQQRGAATAAFNRQQAELTRQSIEMWTNAWLAWLPAEPLPTPRRKSAPRRPA